MSAEPKVETLHGGAERLPVRWPNVETPPFRISRYRVAPGASVSPHVHTGKIEYWLIVSGKGRVRIGSDDLDVTEGDVVRTGPGVAHALANTGGAALEFVNIVELTGDADVTTIELAP